MGHDEDVSTAKAGGADAAQTTVLEENPAMSHGVEDEAGPVHAETSDPLVGTLVGDRYRVLKHLGSGGMGAVYLAEHVHMKKNVALKVLHRTMSAKPDVVARFEREAFVSGQLDHPNVAQATDFGQLEDGTFYLVLELLEGRSLSEAVAGRPMPVTNALEIAGQVAEALSAAHKQGVVHRDLKPDNIMLLSREDGTEHVKVVDFGVAKLASSGSGGLTLAGMIFGTPKYMAPEQAAGQAVDHRADLYALGVVLYEMLAGYPPFDGQDVRQVLAMHLTQEVPPLPEEIPSVVRELVLGLLEKEPDRRISSADEVVDSILATLSPEGGRALKRTRMAALAPSRTLADGLAGHDRVRERRSSVLFVVGFVVVAGVALGLSYGLSPNPVDAVSPPSSAAPEIGTGDAGGEPDPQLEKLLEQAIKGDSTAVATLEARPASERGVREWSALARGLLKLKRDAQALEAYRALLTLDRGAATDSAIINYVWRMANNPETAAQALDIAATKLGDRGADLIYHVWVSTRARNSITELAERHAKSEQVRNAASPALRFVLELRVFENDCTALSEVLPRGTLHGDARAFRVLQKLKVSNTCNLPVEALDAALTAVQERPAPQPF